MLVKIHMELILHLTMYSIMLCIINNGVSVIMIITDQQRSNI